jgi:hypothetical protein
MSSSVRRGREETIVIIESMISRTSEKPRYPRYHIAAAPVCRHPSCAVDSMIVSPLYQRHALGTLPPLRLSFGISLSTLSTLPTRMPYFGAALHTHPHAAAPPQRLLSCGGRSVSSHAAAAASPLMLRPQRLLSCGGASSQRSPGTCT